ncbi:MAG: protein kinase domain-containing protein [Planctomycetota bacterium]
MAEMTAEKFAQRAFDYDLVDAHQLESVWGEFGSREVPLDEFTKLMVRRELLTNFQVDRLLSGKREGYFYGNYKVLYMVGSGTFARVYRATHRESKRHRAVKVLRKRYAEDMVTTQQFLREARVLMPLRHPNIVPVHEVLEEHHRPFMVMDFIEGQNLRDFIKVRKRLDLEVSLGLTADVLSGLDYALDKGVTHRDMKLSNVLISSHGRAKLVDFGLAAITADMSEEAIAAAANPRSIDYAGLERITGVRKNDPRSDIYFTGVMLYHILSGKPPLHETRDRIKRLSVERYRGVKPLGAVLPNCPNYVVALVNKAMDLKADRRYQTPRDMLDDLERVMERVKAGDKGVRASEAMIDRNIPDNADSATNNSAANNGAAEREGENRTVMLVESHGKTQDAMRNALKKRGYRVLVFGSPRRALQRFEGHLEEEPLADCIIFSARELEDEAVDAFNEFGEDESTKDIPAILLVKRANKDQIRRARTNERRVVLPLGLKIRQLRAKLFELLRKEEPSNS